MHFLFVTVNQNYTLWKIHENPILNKFDLEIQKKKKKTEICWPNVTKNDIFALFDTILGEQKS